VEAVAIKALMPVEFDLVIGPPPVSPGCGESARTKQENEERERLKHDLIGEETS
jgi:hypothetical protein